MIQSQCGMKWMCKCHKHHIKYISIYRWNQSWFSVVWNECARVANTTSNLQENGKDWMSLWKSYLIQTNNNKMMKNTTSLKAFQERILFQPLEILLSFPEQKNEKTTACSKTKISSLPTETLKLHVKGISTMRKHLSGKTRGSNRWGEKYQIYPSKEIPP